MVGAGGGIGGRAGKGSAARRRPMTVLPVVMGDGLAVGWVVRQRPVRGVCMVVAPLERAACWRGRRVIG